MDEHAREAGHLEHGEHHPPEHGEHHDIGPTFEMVDADGNDEISLEEATRFFMRDFVEEYEGQAITEHKEVFKAVDKNADRIVDRAEFAAEKARQEKLGPDEDHKDAQGDWQYQGGPPPEGGN
jgi:hypothetical protein